MSAQLHRWWMQMRMVSTLVLYSCRFYIHDMAWSTLQLCKQPAPVAMLRT